jgi:predicted esterase
VTKHSGLRLLLGLALFACHVSAGRADEKSWWTADIERALVRAGANRSGLVNALGATPLQQRAGMAFLIANMPERDLKSLGAEFLLENVALAYEARKQVSWGRQIPDDVFLNDILPYANVDEARDPWRKKLFELCLPLVKDCKTPGEAGQRLNSKIFTILKVRYGTTRKQPHQSPRESIELGIASCTGLSILLADACRSVAVPARLAGTPMWVNMRGNHTWVEIWDRGWHYTGACEADPKGLDRGWFADDAATAKKDSPLHAIYAASFKKTGVTFPLVWAPERKDVFAENVTDRYAKPSASSSTAEPLPGITNAVRAYFAADKEKQKQWHFDAALDRVLADKEEAVRQAVWKVYREAPIHGELREDFARQQARYQKHVSSYVFKKVGKRPENGWPLFIAMHGGGGVPKEVNDSQWQVMQRYYRDQSSVPGYLYLALRAPNDIWNGFYDEYMPPLAANLIQQFLLFGDVDPDKVFLMGYSHGGYGAFFIGPKIPDRFAAVHASAAAPTDNTISARCLRGTRFTFMIGENDNAFGRRKRCEAFNDVIQKLKAKDKDDFPVLMELKQGFGHGGLPDRDKIKDMYSYRRNPVPRHITWDLTDAVIRQLFWLSVPQPGRDQSLDAAIRGNTVRVVARKVKEFDVYLDGRLISFDKPVRIQLGDKSQEHRLRPSLLTLCQSLHERGDPRLAFSCRVRVPEMTDNSRQNSD